MVTAAGLSGDNGRQRNRTGSACNQEPVQWGYTSVEEIEQAIRALGEDEFARIADHIHALEQERRHAELHRDARSGKPDFLIDEAREDRQHGRLKDWPPPE